MYTIRQQSRRPNQLDLKRNFKYLKAQPFGMTICLCALEAEKERNEKRGYRSIICNPLEFLEAASGVEPLNNGFADHCLGHLATPPQM